MSFIHPERKESSSKNAYFITVIAVLISYLFIGQIPLVAAVYLADGNSAQPMNVLKESYGLTPTFCFVIFPLLCVFIALMICIRYVHHWKISSVFNATGAIRFKRILFSFLVWALLSGMILVVGWNDQIHDNFEIHKFVPLFLIALLVIPIQCAAEEILFRSYLFQWLGIRIKKVWVIVLIGGLFFGFLHGANPEIGKLGAIALVYYVWSGIFLGLITAIDDGIELSLGYHIANNLFATLIITSDWQAFQTDALLIDQNPPSFTFITMLLLILSQLIFTFIFSKMYKWQSISERLR